MAASLAVVGILARDLLGRIERFAASKGRLTGPVRAFLAYGAAAGVCAVGIGIVVRTVAQLG